MTSTMSSLPHSAGAPGLDQPPDVRRQAIEECARAADAFVLVRTNDVDLAIAVGERLRELMDKPA